MGTKLAFHLAGRWGAIFYIFFIFFFGWGEQIDGDESGHRFSRAEKRPTIVRNVDKAKNRQTRRGSGRLKMAMLFSDGAFSIFNVIRSDEDKGFGFARLRCSQR
jgi:hypothetical protein